MDYTNYYYYYLCLVEISEISPVDYGLNQYELTEQLLHVEDHEVYLKRRHNMSQRKQILVNINKLGSYVASNQFKQQALIDMMDGVLEKKWEDELRKDVPKPECLVVYICYIIFKIEL